VVIQIRRGRGRLAGVFLFAFDKATDAIAVRWSRGLRPLRAGLFRIWSRYRSPGIPATISLRARPVFLCAAISRIVSTDSCLAGSMKLQVFTTITSASAGVRSEVRDRAGRG